MSWRSLWWHSWLQSQLVTQRLWLSWAARLARPSHLPALSSTRPGSTCKTSRGADLAQQRNDAQLLAQAQYENNEAARGHNLELACQTVTEFIHLFRVIETKCQQHDRPCPCYFLMESPYSTAELALWNRYVVEAVCAGGADLGMSATSSCIVCKCQRCCTSLCSCSVARLLACCNPAAGHS